MKRVMSALAVALFAASSIGAQSTPPIARSKLVATHAVNQTNAHTSAMQNVTDSIPAAKAPAAATKPATEAPKPAEAAKGDTVPVREVESSAGATEKTSASGGFEREIFYYERNGRRDPFQSLMSSSDLRPLISDIKLVAVAFDASGRNSVAVLRDLNTKDQYRVRVGQTLGRMRVAAINPKFITFTIEEFGFSRQETLALGDSNTGSSK
ncbi:MAG: hypothetical protein U0132_02680 [Gemmatimonadaceae bacterium]